VKYFHCSRVGGSAVAGRVSETQGSAAEPLCPATERLTSGFTPGTMCGMDVPRRVADDKAAADLSAANAWSALLLAVAAPLGTLGFLALDVLTGGAIAALFDVVCFVLMPVAVVASWVVARKALVVLRRCGADEGRKAARIAQAIDTMALVVAVVVILWPWLGKAGAFAVLGMALALVAVADRRARRS
jgi:hypothetical protein